MELESSYVCMPNGCWQLVTILISVLLAFMIAVLFVWKSECRV
jgi:hypothetical protein